MNKFWKWIDATRPDPDEKEKVVPEEPETAPGAEPAKEDEPEKEKKADGERILLLHGPIAEESWFDDDVTPAAFREELCSQSGPVNVWINSPGGDCVAASQIYTMLTAYPGKVTVTIEGIAASAASVIAMAGDKVLMSPTANMMIHNPMTMAFGNAEEMQKAIACLEEIKESIINAYEVKTGLSRSKISRLMDEETWMNAKRAIELGFADEMLTRTTPVDMEASSTSYSRASVTNSLITKIAEQCRIHRPGVSVDDVLAKLDSMQNTN